MKNVEMMAGSISSMCIEVTRSVDTCFFQYKGNVYLHCTQKNKDRATVKMVEILKDANINVARRTVAKYREMLRVLPSNKRKRIQGGPSACKKQ